MIKENLIMTTFRLIVRLQTQARAAAQFARDQAVMPADVVWAQKRSAELYRQARILMDIEC